VGSPQRNTPPTYIDRGDPEEFKSLRGRCSEERARLENWKGLSEARHQARDGRRVLLTHDVYAIQIRSGGRDRGVLSVLEGVKE